MKWISGHICVEYYLAVRLTNKRFGIKEQNVYVWILKVGSDALYEQGIGLLFQEVTSVAGDLLAGSCLNLKLLLSKIFKCCQVTAF